MCMCVLDFLPLVIIFGFYTILAVETWNPAPCAFLRPCSRSQPCRDWVESAYLCPRCWVLLDPLDDSFIDQLLGLGVETVIGDVGDKVILRDAEDLLLSGHLWEDLQRKGLGHVVELTALHGLSHGQHAQAVAGGQLLLWGGQSEWSLIRKSWKDHLLLPSSSLDLPLNPAHFLVALPLESIAVSTLPPKLQSCFQNFLCLDSWGPPRA